MLPDLTVAGPYSSGAAPRADRRPLTATGVATVLATDGRNLVAMPARASKSA